MDGRIVLVKELVVMGQKPLDGTFQIAPLGAFQLQVSDVFGPNICTTIIETAVVQ